MKDSLGKDTRKFRQIIASAASIFIFAVIAAGQETIESRIDSFVRGEMARQKIPGVSLAIIQNGKPLLVKGYGLANVEHQVPVRPETIFQSGSVGKQFTAFAIMLLVEDGKIRLDEKISKYLGEVPATWSNITIRHLLTHTSGMTDYPRDFDNRKDYTEEEFIRVAKAVPTAFAPGEKWAYSNLGYMTLGVIIGKVTGKFYGDFLKERVFSQLGMSTARVISEYDIIPNRAAGYQLRNGEIKNQAWVSPSLNTTADGSLYLSALDMIKWDEALAAGKLLSKASYDQMWTPVRLADGKEQPYGFGWGIRRINGKRLIDHSGAWQGFRSYIGRYPEDRVTIIVFANCSNANPDRIAGSVAAIVNAGLKPIPVQDPDPRRSAEFRKVFESILEGSIDKSRITPQLTMALKDPEDGLLAHLKTLGPILKFELVDIQGAGDKNVWQYTVEFGSMTIILDLMQDKDGKISHFVLQPQ